MTRCPLLCGRRIKKKENSKGERIAILEKEKIVRWVVDNKED